jgi:signal transduction histidine kinase/ActR/RegA family two-component response regulator
MRFWRIVSTRWSLGTKTLSSLFDIAPFDAITERQFRASQEAHFIYIMSALSCLAFLSIAGFSIQRALGAIDLTHNQNSRLVAIFGAVAFGLLSAVLITGIGTLDFRKKLATAGYYLAGCIGTIMNSFRTEIRFDGDVVGFAMILLTTSASSRLLHRTAISWLLVSLSAYYLLQLWMYTRGLGPYSKFELLDHVEVIDIRKINIYVFQAGICAYFMFRFNEARERRLFERECKLEKSAKERLELLQAIGHDLRQPMTAISLHCGLAKNAFFGNDSRQFDLSLEVVEDSLEVMNAELTQITEIAETGGFAGRHLNQVVNLTEILVRLHDSFSARAVSENIRLALVMPETSSHVDAFSDPIQLRKIITNLLNNAFKYAKPFKVGIDRAVVLTLSQTPANIRLEIHDTGVGIADENVKRIWEPFFQVGNPERNRDRGFGLGLAHVKNAVQQLPGHSVMVHSEIGIGTTFVLEIPLVTASDDLVVLDPNPIVETRGYSEPADVMKADISGVLVFILEDDAVLRLALVQALQQAGTLTSAASDLHSARELYMSMELIPDVLIVDHRLPDGSGRDFILDINRHAVEFGLTAPPVIYLTGEHSSALKLDDLGNVTLLRKPTDIQTLLRTIASLVNVST